MQGSPTPGAVRALKLAEIDALAAAGMSTRRACAEAGVLFVNYYRWKADAARLASGLAEVRQTQGQRGRPVKFDLTPEEARRLKFWRLVKGSIPLAVEAAMAEAGATQDNAYLASLENVLAATLDRGQKIRPETAAALRQHWQTYTEARRPVVWPMSIQRACRVSEDEDALFRGKKAASARLGTERRGAFIVDEDGQRVPWFPGAIYCSDDMSLNEPFRFVDGATGQEMLGRQALFTDDAFSLRFLGASHIGRDRDSYRAADIADHFSQIVDAHGMPLVWRIEKGRWNNHFIFGCPIPGEFDPDSGEPVRFGGLDALFSLAVKHESRGKEIEGCFNLLQSIMAHGGNGQAVSIGRHRGEFEAATRLAARAERDPAAMAKFWSIAASADFAAESMRLFNARPKKRQAFGNRTFSPDELWAGHVKRPVPVNERWRFLPVKVPARVRRGVVEVQVRHYGQSFRFRVNGGARIGAANLVDGHEVMLAFHPDQAWEGCQVFNRDRSARNRDGWRWLERLGTADFMADAPQEDLSDRGGHSPGQKRQASQVRREFRALVDGSDLAGHRRSHAQDHLGNALTRAKGGTAPDLDGRGQGIPERIRGGHSEGRLVIPSRGTAPDLDLAEEEEALATF